MFRKRRMYLDYASGAEGNPSSPHTEGRAAKKQLEAARVALARLLEVKADDVIFTSGATEANNLAIRGLAKLGSHFLYLPSSHASVVETMRELGAEPLVIKNGRVDIEALRKMLRPETSLISMDAVCGETGTIWNTREVSHAIQQTAPQMQFSRSLGASQPLATKIAFPSRPLLHIDASQALLTEKCNRAHFAADLLTLDAQKVGGPRSVGVLVAHRTIPLVPIMTGGGQERGQRPGTENPEGAAAFAAALGAAVESREDFGARAKRARRLLVATITSNIPNVYINEGAEGVPHILNISLPGRDTDYLVALLDACGYAVSTRSACETDSKEGSRAVFALTKDQKRAMSTLRISWGSAFSELEIVRFARVLAEQVAFLDSSASKSHY